MMGLFGWIVLFLLLPPTTGRLKGQSSTAKLDQDLVDDIPRHRRMVDAVFARELDDDMVRVWVGYNSSWGRTQVEQTALIVEDFPEIHAVAIACRKKDLYSLAADSDIRYMERDEMVYPYSEIVPYGIKLTKANTELPVPSSSQAGDCSSPRSFKVGIVDSGIYGGHPDLSCSGPGDRGCLGRSFGISDAWYQDGNSHGTHVAGTIGALGQNGNGVRGMVKDDHICYIFARVFDDAGNGASTSSILAAVRWAVNQGAQVINMSLGGSGYSATANAFYNKLFKDKGRIIVAAAGNDGGNVKSYPASYKRVVSVAAIDENMRRAYFSQANNMVDFAAPGVGVLSTIPPGMGGLSWLSIPGDPDPYEIGVMAQSPSFPLNGVSGTISSCDLGKQTCSGSGKFICLIKRGDITFEEKALNCQRGGGSAAVIYNYDPDEFVGTLAPNTQVTIPVAAVSGKVGNIIAREMVGTSATINSVDGLATYSGTSMAAPHVTGAIAAIWRSCQRRCKNTHVMQCLRRTAKDLGAKGRDNVFGSGLIQAKPAYECLKRLCCK